MELSKWQYFVLGWNLDTFNFVLPYGFWHRFLRHPTWLLCEAGLSSLVSILGYPNT